jgi:hypothetical protein
MEELVNDDQFRPNPDTPFEDGFHWDDILAHKMSSRGSVHSSDLYEVYSKWCLANNEKKKTSKDFDRTMKRTGYESSRVSINNKIRVGYKLCDRNLTCPTCLQTISHHFTRHVKTCKSKPEESVV